MSITDGDILRVVAGLGYLDGEINQNVYNCVITGAGSPWDDDDVVDDMEDWLDNLYANVVTIVTSDMDGKNTTVYKYDSIDDDWDEVGANPFTWNPTGGVNDGLPRGVAALITAKSSDPDTAGRKYIPGFVEGVSLGALWDGGTVILLAAMGADWVTPFVGAATGADFTPVVWSVVEKVAKVLSGGISIPTVPAYQRRRKNNVGI